MTADERNKRMKYGHQVPRSWIPEFNVAPDDTPPPQPVDQQKLLDNLSNALRLERRRRRLRPWWRLWD